MQLLARTCNYDRMNVERIIARGLVLAGAAVCIAAVIGSFTWIEYMSSTPMATATVPGVLVVVALVVFAISLYFEMLASALLLVGAVVVTAWGAMSGWDLGIWGAMLVVVIGPMVVSGLMYLMAARTQRTCELTESHA